MPSDGRLLSDAKVRHRAQGGHVQYMMLAKFQHLADLEREGFGLRIRRLLAELNPRLPDFDGTKVARERNYRSLSLAAGLRDFEVAREANIDALQGLSPEAWVRSGTQDGVGTVSLCDMPALMHQHDLAHIAEIQEWKRFNGWPGDA